MTIDERLEKLTERHEALTLTVEPITQDIKALTQSINVLVVNSSQDGENIRALAGIAEAREKRLTDLET
jgi:archaellum component FlaC